MLKRSVLVTLVLLLAFQTASAQDIVLDVKTDKQTYSVGENVTYTVLLMENGQPIAGEVKLSCFDALGKKSINFTVNSNEPNEFTIENDFVSGFWSIEAFYSGKSVRRIFSVGEKEAVEFIITGDKLIITNNGNVPYTKTVQILIGDKIITQKQNIPVGDSKEIKLIAPQGTYNIQVTDGTKTIMKSNVMLAGTGRVIGALDEELVGGASSTFGGGAGTPTDENQFMFSQHFSVAFIFIGAVGALAILIFIERTTRKKANAKVRERLSSLKQQHN